MTHEIIQLMQKLKFTGMRASFEGLVQAKNTATLSISFYKQNGKIVKTKSLPVFFKMQGSVIVPAWKK